MAGRMKRARDVALRLDSREELIDFAERARRHLPGDDRFGDALSTADGTPTAAAARLLTALDERPSLARELGLSSLQMWQAASEGLGRGRGDAEVAVLFTDLVGFSKWSLQAGDEAAVELLRAVGDAVEGAVAAHRGRVVKRLGDGVMAEHARAEDAVLAALRSQRAMDAIDVSGHRPRLRAGVHVGRPRRIGRDLLGVDVNIAARVMDGAGGGEVRVSHLACEQLREGAFDLGRAKRLKAKGVPGDLRVRTVRSVEEAAR